MPSILFQGAIYQVKDDETILDALIRGGADVRFSCRKGSCQACMLRTLSGEVTSSAAQALRAELVQSGHFTPCVSRANGDLVVDLPDQSLCSIRAQLAAKNLLGPGVVQLLLEPEINLTWKPGQYIQLVREDGVTRSYSIASIAEEDYFLELHVKQIETGTMSGWIHATLQPGDELTIQGPMGSCTYDEAFRQRPLILVGTTTGMAPLWGIVRDALRQGHQGPIRIYFGARTASELYLDQALSELARAHDQIDYHRCVSGPAIDGDVRAGRVAELAFQDHAEASGCVVYLCGSPEMVYDARCRAVLAGVRRADIFADPFESAEPSMPTDLEKLAHTAPDPEMWEALDQGTKLRAMLEEFYEQVYEDPRLAPFFHNVTKERAISQQYAFLRDVFSGTHDFMGLRPFNAHHWMVISDELFDYREALFESVLRRHGFSEHLLRRWSAFHELFRREIVKSKERGLVMKGKEYLHQGYSIERLDVGSLCDGCEGEMPPGSQGRMHRRTGKLFCLECGATRSVDAFGIAS